MSFDKVRISARHIGFAVLIFMMLLGAGCKDSEDNRLKISGIEDLNNSKIRIGGATGSLSLYKSQETFPKAQHLEFKTGTHMYMALQSGKIDAVSFDLPPLEYVVATRDDLVILPESIGRIHISVGAPLDHKDLMARVNEYIKQYKADGTYDEMYKRWVKTMDPVMPHIPKPEHPQGTLVIGAECETPPMNFLDKDGNLSGFDMEFIKRLTLFLNMDYKLIIMDYSALFPACAGGKIDLAIAQLDYTPERAENMLFSDNHVDNPISMMIRKSDYAPENEGRQVISALSDLKGKTAGSISGSYFISMVETVQPGIKHISYNTNIEAVNALKKAKVDAVFLDDPAAAFYAASHSDDFGLLSKVVDDKYGFALQKNSPLTGRVSEIIRKLTENGELDALIDKWCSGDSADKQLAVWNHNPDFTGSAGTLRFAADPDSEPTCYLDKDGNFIGLEIDLIRRIAYDLNMKLEISNVPFNALIKAVRTGEADITGGTLSITEERMRVVDMSIPYYFGGVSVLIRKEVAAGEKRLVKLADLKGRKVGTVIGFMNGDIAKAKEPEIDLVVYNSLSDGIEALKKGKIDAMLDDTSSGQLLVSINPDLELGEKYTSEYYGIALKKGSRLTQKINSVLLQLKHSGEIKKLEDKWLNDSDTQKTLTKWNHNPKWSGKNGILKVACDPNLIPIVYLDAQGQFTGFDVDLINRIAYELDMELEIVMISFNSMIETLESGKANLAINGITITEERKQKIDFSLPYMEAGQTIIVRKESGEKANRFSLNAFKEMLSSWHNDFADSFCRTFILEARWKLVLKGLRVTVLITLLSTLFGTILAFPVCLMRRSRNIILNRISGLFIFLMQSTPILVILMIMYYIIFAKVDIDPVYVAVTAFAMNLSAYAGEILLSAINSIPKGQTEAAHALGFGPKRTFVSVILPQAIRQILPVYRGEVISLLKATSIVGYIAIHDLTKMNDVIRSRTYEAFFPLNATALIYIAAAWLMVLVISWLEKTLDPRRRQHRIMRRKGL